MYLFSGHNAVGLNSIFMNWRNYTESERVAEIDHNEFCQKVCQGYEDCRNCAYYISLKRKEIFDC